VAARGCLPPGGQTSVLSPPPIRSATDILMFTTMCGLPRTTAYAKLGGCNYATQIPAESVLQCRTPEAAKFQNTIFSPFPQMQPPAQCRPARMPFSPQTGPNQAMGLHLLIPGPAHVFTVAVDRSLKQQVYVGCCCCCLNAAPTTGS